MASLHDLKDELGSITASMSSIQRKVDDLLERQERLQSRREQIEAEIKRRENVYESSSSEGILEKSWNATDFTWSSALTETLREKFSIIEPRAMQLEAMNATLSKRDVILIMPTGGGKSLCYQAPALLGNMTLVVSPLISLIEDQLISLKDLGISAAKLTSSSTKEEVKSIQQQMVSRNSELKLLYVTPEKISKSKRFMAQLEKCYKAGNLSRIAIDEVHCASQWGNDFRPDYKILGILKTQFPDTPILGLTATSTEKVTLDTKKILNIPFSLVFKSRLNRENLFYSVKTKPHAFDGAIEDVTDIIKSQFSKQSGIIYCFSCKSCEEVSTALNKEGIRSASYHAKMEDRQRHRVHKSWLENQTEVICATVAFGMGINKPDVRFVVHFALSKSVENYYQVTNAPVMRRLCTRPNFPTSQESGRAGRDGGPALCLLYYGFADIFKQSTMVMREHTGLRNLRKMLEYCQNSTGCRRSVLFSHFGNEWTPELCNRSCDVCRESDAGNAVSVSQYCVELVSILQKSTKCNERLTGAKLLDAAAGRGKLKTSDSKLKTLPSESTQRVIVYMLLNNYLKEDFHFTPYSTISYLLPGPRASLLSKSDAKVRLPEPSTEASSNSLRLSFTEFCDAFSEVRGKAQACGVKRSMSACLMSSGAKKSKDDSDSIDLTVECRDEASPILVKDSDDAFE